MYIPHNNYDFFFMRTRKVLELHRAMIEPSYVFHSKQTCTPLLRVEVHSQNCPLANVVDGRDGCDGRGVGGEGDGELRHSHL